MEFNIDKSRFRDEKNRYIVQGLFLEDTYNPELASYTLSGDHKEYKGKMFPSLKKLYLEEGDPNEYTFATTHLYDWPHWLRIVKNKTLAPHVEEWRKELELSLRSEGIATLIDLGINGGSYQAAKWLADKGWDVKEKGRPSNEQIQAEIVKQAKEQEKFSGDIALLDEFKKKKRK
jgi:hypothetical protein